LFLWGVFISNFFFLRLFMDLRQSCAF
jgi:hypothetical protein